MQQIQTTKQNHSNMQTAHYLTTSPQANQTHKQNKHSNIQT